MKKTWNPPPPLTNSIQALEKRERGRWRGQQTALHLALAAGSVALECFGFSRVRFAGCLRGAEKELRLRREQQSGCRTVRLAGLHECKDQADKFLGSM